MQQTIKSSSRSAGIVIHDNKLLLMLRKKFGKIYYAFPGGMVEGSETTQQAARREIAEETTIDVTCKQLVYSVQMIQKDFIKYEFFYLCHYISGTPQLAPDCVELQRQSEQNYYEPLWVELDQIPSLTIYPLEIKDQLLHDLKHGFSNKTIEFIIDKNNKSKP